MIKAINKGSEEVPNWCAGETIDFKVEIVKYDSRADKDEDKDEDEKEDEKQSWTNPKDKIDINYSQYFPFIAFLLSIVNLLFIFILFRRNIKKDTPPQINQRDSQKDIVELKQEVHNLRNLLAKSCAYPTSWLICTRWYSSSFFYSPDVSYPCPNSRL